MQELAAFYDLYKRHLNRVYAERAALQAKLQQVGRAEHWQLMWPGLPPTLQAWHAMQGSATPIAGICSQA